MDGDNPINNNTSNKINEIHNVKDSEQRSVQIDKLPVNNSNSENKNEEQRENLIEETLAPAFNQKNKLYNVEDTDQRFALIEKEQIKEMLRNMYQSFHDQGTVCLPVKRSIILKRIDNSPRCRFLNIDDSYQIIERPEAEAMVSKNIIEGTEYYDEQCPDQESVYSTPLEQPNYDEYGSDIKTTNLLILASQCLEQYAEIENYYAEKEKWAIKVVMQHFHIPLDEFFETVGAITDIKEGLDRYESFLHHLDNRRKRTLHPSKKQRFKDDMRRFKKYVGVPYEPLNPNEPFEEQDSGHISGKVTPPYPSISMYTAVGKHVIYTKRGYYSV